MQAFVGSNCNRIPFLYDAARLNSFLITVVQYLLKELCKSSWRKVVFQESNKSVFFVGVFEIVTPKARSEVNATFSAVRQ